MLKGGLEDNVLTLLCYSDEYANALTLKLTPDLFSTRNYRKIAEKTFAHITAYGRPPGDHLRDIMEDDLRRGEEGTLLTKILDDMHGLYSNGFQAAYVLNELDRYISIRKLTAAVEDASDALARGDIETAERSLYQRDITQAATQGIWLHDTKAMLNFLYQHEEDEYSSGIEIFDRRGISPRRKEMFLVIGAKKVGKSFWAVQAGKENMLRRKKVLHVTLENSEEVTAQRYVQALFALTKEKAETLRIPIFKKDQLGRCTSIDFEQRTFDAITLDNKGSVAKKLGALKNRAHLLIKEFPTGGLTLAHLNAYLDQLSRNENFRPDLLIVDSGNKMAMRGDHFRTDLGQNIIGLRGIAVARNLAVFTTTHSNRQGDGARLVTGAGHVGEDYSMLGTADTICTISRTSAEKQAGLARLLVDAARNFGDAWVAMIAQNYATAQFCLDSVYMNKHIEEEVSKFSGKDDDE